MRDTINVPIAIPAWSLVVFIGSALFTAGTLYSQMSTLIESSKKADDRMALISEKQIGSTLAINSLQQQSQNHEARLMNVERAILDKAKR